MIFESHAAVRAGSWICAVGVARARTTATLDLSHERGRSVTSVLYTGSSTSIIFESYVPVRAGSWKCAIVVARVRETAAQDPSHRGGSSNGSILYTRLSTSIIFESYVTVRAGSSVCAAHAAREGSSNHVPSFLGLYRSLNLTSLIHMLPR